MGAPRADKPKIRYLWHAASLKACFCGEKAIFVKQAAEQVATIQPSTPSRTAIEKGRGVRSQIDPYILQSGSGSLLKHNALFAHTDHDSKKTISRQEVIGNASH